MRNDRQRQVSRTAAPGLALAAALAAAPVWAGGMLISGRDPALAINAWGGVHDGAGLRLHNGCRAGNPECAWTYRGGMLYSDGGSGLAIKAVSIDHGAALVLAAGCQRTIRGCSWTYRDGMFVSDADPTLAIAAWGGARYGTTLRLSKACRAGDPDCNWSRPR